MKPTFLSVILMVALGSAAPAICAASETSPSPAPTVAATTPGTGAASAMGRAKEWLHRFQTGDIDRSQLTAQASSSLTPELVTQAAAQLGPLGDPTSFTFVGSQVIANGSTAYVYRAGFKAIALDEILTLDTSGKVDGVFFKPAP